MIGAQWVLGTFMALAHPDMASSAGPLGAESSDRTVVVNGTLPDIAWARAVEKVLVITPGPHGPVALLLDHAQCAVQEGTNLAGESGQRPARPPPLDSPTTTSNAASDVCCAGMPGALAPPAPAARPTPSAA